MVRRGAYIARNVVLMPSYVNIGAYVDEGTMVDTWATVGSCAQIGKNVHLSGGVGIGGVLEPIQANPVVIEDKLLHRRSVRGRGRCNRRGKQRHLDGCVPRPEHPHLDRESGTISYGRVPAGSVVVSGSLPSPTAAAGCTGVIVKKVDARPGQNQPE